MPRKQGRDPRGSVVTCELVDQLGEQIRREALVCRNAREDGFIEPDESRLMDFEHAKTERLVDALAARTSQQDGVFRMIQMFSTTCAVTPHTDRYLGYAVADEARLLEAEARLLEAA